MKVNAYFLSTTNGIRGGAEKQKRDLSLLCHLVAVWLVWFHDLPVPRVEPSLRGSGVW